MDVAVLVIAAATLLVAVLAFLAVVTDWLKRTIPVEVGFLHDESVVVELPVSTGDKAKPITIRIHNKAKTTVTGLVLDMRFLKPLSLSGTGTALSMPLGDSVHGRVPDGSYYLVRYSAFDLFPDQSLDFRVELNLTDTAPQAGRVRTTVYSSQQDYKYRKADLILHIT